LLDSSRAELRLERLEPPLGGEASPRTVLRIGMASGRSSVLSQPTTHPLALEQRVKAPRGLLRDLQARKTNCHMPQLGSECRCALQQRMIKQKGTQPSRHLQKGADVEAKGDLSCRVVRRSREAGDERTVEAADARLGFVGVDRGLPQIGNEGEKEEHIYTGSWRDECFTENAKQDSTQL